MKQSHSPVFFACSLTAFLLLALWLGGCGKVGPLVLPPDQAASAEEKGEEPPEVELEDQDAYKF